jgi:hypothetical protein
MPRSRRALACLMAVLCTLATPSWGTDAVLCFGDDGHVSVEVALDGRCASGQCGPVSVYAGLLDPSAIQCDPCLDIPLLQQPAVALSRSTEGHRSLHPALDRSPAALTITTVPGTLCLLAGRAPKADPRSTVHPLHVTGVLQV